MRQFVLSAIMLNVIMLSIAFNLF